MLKLKSKNKIKIKFFCYLCINKIKHTKRKKKTVPVGIMCTISKYKYTLMYYTYTIILFSQNCEFKK